MKLELLIGYATAIRTARKPDEYVDVEFDPADLSRDDREALALAVDRFGNVDERVCDRLRAVDIGGLVAAAKEMRGVLEQEDKDKFDPGGSNEGGEK